MNLTLRRAASGLVTAFLVCTSAVAAAPAATAHPLGNFTVNHYTGLTLHPDRIEALVVVDRAEIAAAQEHPLVDLDHNGRIDTREAGTYARRACTEIANQLLVSVGSRPAAWRPSTSALTHHPGEAGLKTSRLQCALTTGTGLRSASDIKVRTTYDSRRIGWREITARGEGVLLTDSDVPTRSATNELRRYPQDPLATPLDQRAATLRVEPGRGNAASAVRDSLPGAGPVGAALNKVSGVFDSLVGSRELTLPVGFLALLLAVVLGASHAAMPGHGKTIMAAYLAGRRGTPKDAVTIGATVTLTHTSGVLVLGLTLPVATHLAGETVLTWLGTASGLIVTAIGLWLLRSALLHRPVPHHHHHGHTHHHHDHDHAHDHGGSPHELPVQSPARPSPHDADAVQPSGTGAVLTKTHAPHGHTHPQPGPPIRPPARSRRTTLIGMGIAGGLVPSPSAIVVLLGAIALGRTAFGVLLVAAYGIGMAGTLTLAGLLLVRLGDRITTGIRTAEHARWAAALKRLARYGPVATSSLVLLVGVGLTIRSAVGPW
ncbi:nickel transporter [Streptomyces sp. ISL-96]|uniref:nickel/cobalt transporter n=1 Tax=Streptomyces sp. ISL-96 TaxID=2819191 RepID=UPI001BE9A5C3|nr:nickel transporter [Streptomyces sp. ISL-96]MBT2487185.1 nickel transporter [Streptomyces sp. ISL-96]